jgi:Holliday junction DNA helicase RuvA
VIGRLRGEIVAKHPPMLLLDVNGVGYEIEAPMSTFYDLPAVGEKTTLFTHLAIREDAHVLYGFIRETDRGLFRSLLKVSGVGGKMALAILSGMNAGEFAQCIQAGDIASLTRVPGVGKKTAERLVVEMRDRLDQISASDVFVPGAVGGAQRAESPTTEAASALVALGYKPVDASRMVKAVAADAGTDPTSEQLIRAALQSVAKKG